MATSPDIGREIAERLKKAKSPSHRREIVQEYVTLGISETKVYRLAKEYGYESNRQPREDAGAIKSITEDQIKNIEKIIYLGRNKVGKHNMPTTTSIDIAETNGRLEPGQVSASTMNRILRHRKTDRRSTEIPSPHVTMQSVHPNHAHLFDVTNCNQYRFDKKSLKVVNIEKEFYKNRPQVVKRMREHIFRYVITDHTTGHLYVDYFLAAGEKAADAVSFLLDAWSEKDDEHLPFHGVPEILIQDKGSALNSQVVKNLMKNLGVEMYIHKPGNPRAKGSVENAMRVWETHFESRLLFDKPRDLNEIRAMCRDYLVYFNATEIHSRTGMTRTEGWLKIRAEQLRKLPPREICQYLAHSAPEDRTVKGALIVKYEGKDYSVRYIPGILPRDKVLVQYDPFSYPAVIVTFEDEKYKIDPIEKTEFGFPVDAPVIGQEFKSHKETVIQKRLKEAEAVDLGEIKTLGFHRERLGKVTFMHRDGDEIDLPEKSYEAPGITRAKACTRIAEILGRHITREENRIVAERYGPSVPEDAIKALAEEFGLEDQEKTETSKEV